MADTLNKLLEKLPEELAKKIPDVKLRDQDIDVAVAQGTFTRDNILPPMLDLKAFTLSFEAGGAGSIRNFNSPGDKDENGVVGEVSEVSSDPQSASLQPQLLLDGSQGWMRYQVAARIKAGAGAGLPFLAADAQAELNVMLADYRTHGLDERMREAAKADLGAPRLVVQKTDLAKLGVGDALAWQARGQLKSSVTLSWADLFTANLAPLSFVRSSELVALKLSLSATLSASVSLTDDFLLSFSRPRAGRIQVSVRKVKSREAALGAGLGPTVEFADKAAIQKQLGDVVTALAGKPMAEVDALVEKASKKQLTDAQKKVLAAVLERLGLDPQLADLSTLKQTWEDLKGRIQTTLGKVAEARIAASFRYEYLRIPQSSTLLQVELDDATAMKFHGSLLRGDLVDLLAWLREPANQKSFTLKNYLRQSGLTQQRAYGFTLGLGSTEVLKSRTTQKQSWVTQENLQGARRMAFLGQRGYEDKLLGNRGQWTVDLKAEMTQFSPTPAASDFYYGLHLLLSGRQKKLSKKELQSALDDAIVWGALDTKDLPKVLESLQDVVGNEAIETQLDLKLDNDTFRALLPRLQDFDLALFSRALARAMPWSDEAPRASVDVRRLVYGPMWELYLREVQDKGSFLVGDLSPTRAAEIAEWVLKRDQVARELGKDLLGIESIFTPPGRAFSFAEVTNKNSGTLGKCREFVEGIVHLRGAIDQRWGPDAIKTAFGKLEGMWNTGFHVRATGALLVELAQGTSRGLAGVERTFTVKRVEKNEQLVFSTARGPGSK